MGRCGSPDVADVMQAVDYVTATLKKGDPTKLYARGSHGTWRVRGSQPGGQHRVDALHLRHPAWYPFRFILAALRKVVFPLCVVSCVVRVVSCVVCDVLPIRCLVEALRAGAWEMKEVIDKADLVRLWESCVSCVCRVCVVCVVSCVPPSQGEEWHSGTELHSSISSGPRVGRCWA
jgi:hypothetical protein